MGAAGALLDPAGRGHPEVDLGPAPVGQFRSPGPRVAAQSNSKSVRLSPSLLRTPTTAHANCAAYAKVCTITGPAIAVAGPASSGVRLSSIHASARLFDSSAPA